MLLCAMPRSASTSFAKAICDATGVEFRHLRPMSVNPETQVNTWGDPPVPSLPNLGPEVTQRGREFRNWTRGALQTVLCREGLYRQHVPPTTPNIAFIQDFDVPYVVHVRRDVNAVLSSFYRRIRQDKSGVPYFLKDDAGEWERFSDGDPSMSAWVKHCREVGATTLFEHWVEVWADTAEHDDNGLLTTYEGAIENPTRAVSEVCRHLSIDLRDSFEIEELPKERYTRDE
ncbi:MAG: sulfotransferase domain-containing protein [Bradymonadaceae bacterium]